MLKGTIYSFYKFWAYNKIYLIINSIKHLLVKFISKNYNSQSLTILNLSLPLQSNIKIPKSHYVNETLRIYLARKKLKRNGGRWDCYLGKSLGIYFIRRNRVWNEYIINFIPVALFLLQLSWYSLKKEKKMLYF